MSHFAHSRPKKPLGNSKNQIHHKIQFTNKRNKDAFVTEFSEDLNPREIKN